ncbi:MAG: alpha-amylase/4-alpha-glucanotransferase domain-containing protein [Promethearchaeota archaeon]
MTEKTIYFPIVFHFHQPVDNFPWVYEDCFKKSYGPLIDNIYKYPEVKVTLHFSGNLLEWLIEHKPDFIKKIKEMAERKQIEIIGGGYYEPIFAIIPHRDKIAQMRKLSDLIENEFGLEVSGAWLSERVWEPHYPSFLNEVGLKYVIVDDNHFRSTGLTEEDTFYTYITEDEGKTLRIFPINEPLRYLMPWKPTYMSIDYLRKAANEKGDRVCLFISDAEKMGVWGTTHQICYVDGCGHQEGDGGKPFIPAFFEQIINNKWIKSITCAEYIKKFPARNLVYLPTASYDKMEEWVLPTHIRERFEEIRETLRKDPNQQDLYMFLKGGFWRYFLVKYPESNNMHKKMLYVREKLINIEKRIKDIKDEDLIKKIQIKIQQAWDEIYKSQCNDCYWHGMFGGIYLQFLRFSVYTHLINAEKIIDEINKIISEKTKTDLKKDISIITEDFIKNSRNELIIESDILNVYFNPFDGGTIFELDYKPKSYNLLNTLTRWREAYHDEEKENENNKIKNDKYRRSMLRIRFFYGDVTLQHLYEDSYFEFADFLNGEFQVIEAKSNEKAAHIILEKTGKVKDPASDYYIPCKLQKKIMIEKNNILLFITGEFNNDNPEALSRIINGVNIGIDIPFFFNGDQREFQWSSTDLKIKQKDNSLLEPFEYIGNDFKAYDKSYDLTLNITTSSNTGRSKIIKFPIIAYAFTDEGYKEIYQGINLITQFKLNKSFEVQISIKIH